MQSQTCVIAFNTIVRCQSFVCNSGLGGTFQLYLQDGRFACPLEMAVVALALCSYAVGIKPNWRPELKNPLWQLEMCEEKSYVFKVHNLKHVIVGFRHH